MMLYYSVRTRQALKQGMGHLPLGLPHYSYGIVCQKFLSLFSTMGLQAIELPMPEIYPDYQCAMPGVQPVGQPIHLMFKAFDEFRVLKGAYNIAHVAWEYDRLPTFGTMPKFSSKRVHPLNDYVNALRLVDEIWVGCSFTKKTLERHGLSNVHVIPAPIDVASGAAPGSQGRPGGDAVVRTPLQIVEGTRPSIARAQLGGPPATYGEGLFMRIAEGKRRGGRIFLSIFNPHDPRKNPGPLLSGFQRYVQRSRTADMLIVKILVDGKHNTLDDIFQVIFPRRFGESLGSFELIDCENIIFVCGLLSDLEMDRLYQATDFYLCTSNAEGQNLPLLEAMGRGVVPISPATTAMADYVGEANSIVLQADMSPIYESVAAAYGLTDARWHEVSPRDVSRGIETAVALDSGTLKAKRAAAVQTVHKDYSLGAVAALVEQRFGALAKPSAAIAEIRSPMPIRTLAQ